MGVDNTDIQDTVLLGMTHGALHAVDIFSRRMEEINAQRQELNQAEYFRRLAIEHSKQSRTLLEISTKLESLVKSYQHKTDRLEKNEEILKNQLDMMGKTVLSKIEYINNLLGRLRKIEDLSVRQSANLYALEQYKDLVIQELSEIQNTDKFTSLDAEKRNEFIEGKLKEFMKTNSVPKQISPM